MKILGTLTVDTANALDKVTDFNADLLDGKSSELFLSRASTTGVYIADTAIFIDNSVNPAVGGGRLKIYDRASADTSAKGISIGKLYSDNAADITTIDADLYISLATDRDFKLFTNPTGTSSTNRLTVLSNGNVGISKANPTAKLQVYVGSTETTLHPLLITAPTKTVFDIDFSGNIGINAAADSTVQLLLYGERTSTTGFIYGIKNDLTYAAANGVVASIYSMYIGTTINANTNFATAAALFIQAIGGTGTPTAKYGIYQAGASDTNYFNGATTINSSLTVTAGAKLATASGNVLIGTTADNGVNKLQVNGGVSASGSLVLGSTYAESKLHVVGNGNAGVIGDSCIRAYSANGTAYADLVFNGLNVSANSTNMLFCIAQTERMRITNGGNLLIGTTTDDGINKLQVSGSANVNGTLSVTGAITAANISDSYYWAFKVTGLATSCTTNVIDVNSYGAGFSGVVFKLRKGDGVATNNVAPNSVDLTYKNVFVYRSTVADGTTFEQVFPDIEISSVGRCTLTFATYQTNYIFRVVFS